NRAMARIPEIDFNTCMLLGPGVPRCPDKSLNVEQREPCREPHSVVSLWVWSTSAPCARETGGVPTQFWRRAYRTVCSSVRTLKGPSSWSCAGLRPVVRAAVRGRGDSELLSDVVSAWFVLHCR